MNHYLRVDRDIPSGYGTKPFAKYNKSDFLLQEIFETKLSLLWLQCAVYKLYTQGIVYNVA